MQAEAPSKRNPFPWPKFILFRKTFLLLWECKQKRPRLTPRPTARSMPMSGARWLALGGRRLVAGARWPALGGRRSGFLAEESDFFVIMRLVAKRKKTTIQHKVVEDAKKMNLLFLNNDVDVSCSHCTCNYVWEKQINTKKSPGMGQTLKKLNLTSAYWGEKSANLALSVSL